MMADRMRIDLTIEGVPIGHWETIFMNEQPLVQENRLH
jgi:hypothetical protein